MQTSKEPGLHVEFISVNIIFQKFYKHHEQEQALVQWRAVSVWHEQTFSHEICFVDHNPTHKVQAALSCI